MKGHSKTSNVPASRLAGCGCAVTGLGRAVVEVEEVGGGGRREAAAAVDEVEVVEEGGGSVDARDHLYCRWLELHQLCQGPEVH